MEVKNYLYSIVILASSAVNDKSNLEKNSEKILTFLNEKIPEHSLITIGKINNGTLIDFLKNKGFGINEKKQHPGSLGASNYKLINESDIALFLNYNSSDHMEMFIKYTSKLKDKTYYVLKLSD